MALRGSGLIRVPQHAVSGEIADKRLEVLFGNVSLSPGRMCAYYARQKPLPAKTVEFVSFLAASSRS